MITRCALHLNIPFFIIHATYVVFVFFIRLVRQVHATFVCKEAIHLDIRYNKGDLLLAFVFVPPLFSFARPYFRHPNVPLRSTDCGMARVQAQANSTPDQRQPVLHLGRLQALVGYLTLAWHVSVRLPATGSAVCEPMVLQ